MITVESIEPTPKQILAYKAPETYILYGGAMGGGKSVWLVNYAIELSMRHPGNRGFLCRHELASFKKTTQLTMEEWLPIELLAQHNKSDHFYKFKNGSVIYYGGLGDDIRAIEKLKSLEIGWFGIDQAEETTENFFFMLTSRLRHKLPNLHYKGLLTANPTANWVKVRFIDQSLSNHCFIQALPKDNPHNPPDYEDRLKETLPEELVEIWVKGDWSAISETQNVYGFKAVTEAMERELKPKGKVSYGVDVAEYGTDETVIAKKHGNVITIIGTWVKQDPMETTGKVIQLAKHNKEVEIRVDAIGPGSGVYYRLIEQGYNAIPIKGSEAPHRDNKLKFKNIKTQHYWDLRDNLRNLSLPKDDLLRAQMTSCEYKVLSSDGLYRIESKEELRKRGLRSPDRLEAIIYANANMGSPAHVYVLGGKEAEEKDADFASAMGDDDWEQRVAEQRKKRQKEGKEEPDELQIKLNELKKPEIARKYLELSREGKAIDEIAKELGIEPSLLRRFVGEYREYILDVGKGGGTDSGRKKIETI